ncbi:hypothetical protein GCM10022243_52630 [Saccharothrix violaceirubra]|uniref:DUF397 domain-containing protein n=1 Tax=Saccharothrix violaceirubra TaxID=413306 RepID=A0A7W7SYR7_9PSEU|nr:hypothetical protein [Saccharothrix violaceirubra]MBB4963325.1 hypothetical protein [Saccharothrix violaceirubra]
MAFEQREWLLRCTDKDESLATCSIEVSAGRVEVWAQDRAMIGLSGTEIVHFRTALDDAIARAGRDRAEVAQG